MKCDGSNRNKKIIIAGFIAAIMLAVPAIGYAADNSAHTYNTGNNLSVQYLDVDFYHYIGAENPAAASYDWPENNPDTLFESASGFTKEITTEYKKNDPNHIVSDSVSVNDVYVRVTSLIPNPNTYSITPIYMVENGADNQKPTFTFSIGGTDVSSGSSVTGLALSKLYKISINVAYNSTTAPLTDPYDYWITLKASLSPDSAISEKQELTIKEAQKIIINSDDAVVAAILAINEEKGNTAFTEQGHYQLSPHMNTKGDYPEGVFSAEITAKGGNGVAESNGHVTFDLYMPEDLPFVIVIRGISTGEHGGGNTNPTLYLTVTIDGKSDYTGNGPLAIVGATTLNDWEKYVLKKNTGNNLLAAYDALGYRADTGYWMQGHEVKLVISTNDGSEHPMPKTFTVHCGILVKPLPAETP